MELVADLHIHSKYSRAVSQQMLIPEIARWAKIKGIGLVGTGDWTHPLWFLELREWLEEKDGILEIKKGGFEECEARFDRDLPRRGKAGARRGYEDIKFLLTTEISSIYSQGGRTRKIHNLIIAPSFATADKINTELKRRGCNLASDGRPIVGLSAKQVAELVFSVDKNCLLIPCHIWTPHFSLFGSVSGFDSVEECFGDLSKYIYAGETGLSSDPEMNWQIADLDNRSLVSFSDAHSPRKLGRECTVLQVKSSKCPPANDLQCRAGKVQSDSSKFKINYGDVISALIGKAESDWEIGYTIEFYPEEGKYHYTGHRNCGVVQSPEETEKKGTTCSVCGRRLTVGVMERVRKLGKMGPASTATCLAEARRERGEDVKEEMTDENGVRWIQKEGRPPFVRLVPLREIIAESLGVGDSAVSVIKEYQNLTEKLGNETEILMKIHPQQIAKIGGEKLAEGILKVRSGDIFIKPGFDGEYGKVRVWPSSAPPNRRASKGKSEVSSVKEQMSLF